ncbi:uncharacterized protein LOC127506539 isoform X2 [Ctenopharyngodon idella]|uniref:uncharacterized protein LOC127506539 isoform X2 n=1 Tax=Ctenopharyngodon idella TaxID=7959 RepID=UPI002230E45B|nr:uncharacterized protein LOC127506539 isoform X2 [Ctenopharyngodon idella]
MKSLSGRFVLVIVLLQLCLSVQEVSASGKPAGGAAGASASQNQPQFGDLIEFPRTGYSHYAIFVGDKNVTVNGKGDHNIFEMTRDPPGCHFSTYPGPFTIRNDYYTETVQSKEEMIATIEALMRPEDPRCKDYSLRKENCEHVATLVRYGKAMCKQGTAAKIVAGLANPRIKRQKNKQKRREASAAA